MEKIKVMSVFGTRPEAIKMAPLVRKLAAMPQFQSILCVTAQHREMLDAVLDIFDLKLDYDLNIMEPRQSLATITTKALVGLEQVFQKERPDIVLVHGDTTTTFAGALSAFYAKIKIGHVEAGLRTYDKYSPYPEEMNRRLLGQLADLHFAPTAQNGENLRQEGIREGVFVTGNTVIDAMGYTVQADRAFTDPVLKALDFQNRRVLVMTCHRRENYGAPMEQIMAAAREIVDRFPDTELVYPVHLSPVVRETAERMLSGHSRIHLIDPLDTVEMHNLIARSYLVLTDSGGIQEEAPSLGRPVLVLRRETERPEAVRAGTVCLAGVEKERIVSLAAELLTDNRKYQQMAQATNPYGDGHASERIAQAILWSFGQADQPPAPFTGGQPI